MGPAVERRLLMGWYETDCAWSIEWQAFRTRQRYCVPYGYCSNWSWLNSTCGPSAG
jgi:hypothetical protein